MERQLRWVAGIAALAAVVYLGLALWVGWAEVSLALQGVGLGVLLGVTGLSAFNFVVRALRWQTYLLHLGHNIPLLASMRIYFAGFALTVTPGKLGELLRGSLLKPWGVPYASSAALFFVERLADLLAVLILASLVFADHPLALPVISGTWGLVILVMVLAHQQRLVQGIRQIAERRSGRLARGLVALCTTLLEFRRCFEFRPMLLGLIAGLVAWGAQGLAFFWLLQVLGLDLGLNAALFAYAMGLIAGVISFLPGGLGGSEAAMIGLLIWYGAGREIAVTATLVMQISALWFAVGLGVCALWRCRLRMR